MSTSTTPPTPAELADEVATLAVGGGMLTMILFPLALPLIALTVAAVIPMLLVGLAAALAVALVAAPALLIRRLWRWHRNGRPEGDGTAPRHAQRRRNAYSPT